MACDGVPDCAFGEDEDSCPANSCQVGSFLCRYGRPSCLSSGLQCDGKVDCPEDNVSEYVETFAVFCSSFVQTWFGITNTACAEHFFYKHCKKAEYIA